MKKKIIIGFGVSLVTPLTAMAINLSGNQTFTEEVNIPSTHNYNELEGELNSGIDILKNSQTIFEKNVNINLQRNNDSNSDSNISGISTSFDGNSTTVFNGDLNIDVKGFKFDAISIFNNSVIEVNGKTTLNIDHKDNSNAISMIDGILTLNGESIINGDLNVQESGKLIIKNKSQIIGQVEAYDGGIVELYLADGSKFLGSAYSNAEIDPIDGVDSLAGKIIIDLAKNANWEIDEDGSYITQLSGAGSVTFDHNTQTRSLSFKNLTVENLKGALNFTMSTDIAAEKSDKLIIKNSAEGHHTLNLINNGAANTNGKEKLTLVEIAENAISNAEFKTTHAIELGGYVYNINKDGNNWVLASNSNTVTNPNPNLNPDDNKKPDNNTSSKPQITTTANASAGFLNANYLMSYVETQTLLKRLGDMRNSGTFGDVWLRGFSGKLDSFSSGKLSKFDMNYHGFQFGADKQLSENTPFVIGAFVGQTYGDPDYRKGDGSLRSFNTGFYTTYLDESGFYLDGVAKYARQKNHFKVKDTADNRVQGTGHTNGLGVSLELGKKYQINDFYIEPQTQIAYSHQNGTSINATNGLNVKLGNYNSLIGRASALFGYQVNTENSNINLYAKTGIVREFDGDTYYKLNGNKESHSFEGNWWNNSIGVSAQVNKAHTIYLDVESSTGNRFDLLQVNGGYRYSF